MIKSLQAAKWCASLILTFVLFLPGCQDPEPALPSTTGVDGFVQKGPFISGSNMTIQVLDDLFNPTGQSFTVTTVDDFGSFVLETEITGTYIEIIAQGFYFNEVQGSLSNSFLTLRAIVEVTADLKSNVNVLTTLSKNRVIHLVKTEGMDFSDAKAQAEEEILGLFNIPYDESYDFNRMDIGKEGEENAILLAISSVLQGNLSVSELSELLSKIILDIEVDGAINTNTTVQTIIDNALQLDVASIRANLSDRYSQLGLSVTIPDFELFAKLMVPLQIWWTTPLTGETKVPFDLESINMYFNKAIDPSSLNGSVLVTLPSGSQVPGTLTYKADSFKVEYRPQAELLSQTKYKVQILTNLKAADGDALTGDYIYEFTTIGVDVTSNLLAHYPLNGDAQDASGNNLHGSAVAVSYGADVDGAGASACTFSGEGSYLELPNVLNITEQTWTYSIWFRLDDLEAGTAPVLLGTRLSANTFWDIPLYIRSSIKSVVTYNETAFGIPDQITTNNWYHVALVIDSGSISMYLNGELKASKTGFWSDQKNPNYPDFQGDATGSYEFYTGKYYVSEKYRGESFPTYMKGSVDNIRFYRRALNRFEVKKIYNERL